MTRIAAWIALGVAALVVGVWTVWFSPLFAVRQIVVAGAGVVPEQEIVAALAVPKGTPLLRVDTGAAAQRVARIPRVAQSRVRVEFPSRLHITVVDRIPMVYFESQDGAHLMDAAGVEYAIGPPPPGVPRLLRFSKDTGTPGVDDPSTKAALTVLTAAPAALRGQVEDIAARSVSDITLTLRDKRVVKWGSTAESDRKAAIAMPLLSRPGRTYDVSSPDLPTVK